MYEIVYTKKSIQDIQKLKSVGLDKKTKMLIDVIKNDPYQNPPTFEKLQGDLLGAFSRRINIKHGLVYQVYEQEQKVKIVSMWSHYDI